MWKGEAKEKEKLVVYVIRDDCRKSTTGCNGRVCVWVWACVREREVETDRQKEKFAEINLMVDILCAYASQPEVTLKVNDYFITFLCDSGAHKTVINLAGLPGVGRGEELIFIQAANGVVTKENLSQGVIDPVPRKKTKCSVVLSKVVACNLLGRDIMHSLGIGTAPTSDGMRAFRRKCECC